MTDLLNVIHEDADLLVVNKPAGLVCHPTKQDERSSLVGRARLHLGPASRPHLVNRLDRETSGVVVIAKNPESARQLGRIWESRLVTKTYLAVVHGHPRENRGLIDAPLGRDEHSRVAIKDCVRPDGAPARTEFMVEQRFTREAPLEPIPLPAQPSHVARLQPFALLRLTPHSGRKHQIRIHLAHFGHPIVGDKIYGGDEDCYLALVENRLTSEQQARLILPHHALHAAHVAFAWQDRLAQFEAPAEPWFVQFWGMEAGEASRLG